MRIVRFLDSGGRELYGKEVAGGSAQVIEGGIFDGFDGRSAAGASITVTGETVAVSKLLAPVVPRSIFCIGLNYRQHAKEGGAPIPEHPVLFMKGANALQNPGDPIEIPGVEPGAVDYECELAVVIGRPAKDVPREDALSYVLGYTCANDVSGRDWQLKKGGGQWCRGKTFDTFFPLGPALVTADEIPDPNALKIQSEVNGEVMQDWTTSDMIFDVPFLISFLSQGTTLLPGTVISTGTPQGVGFARNPPVFLKNGDEVAVEIEKIGRLVNPVTGP